MTLLNQSDAKFENHFGTAARVQNTLEIT